MKKILIALLALVLVFSMAACGGNGDNSDETTDNSGSASYTSLDILNTVWTALPEENKFYCVGGNMNAGTAVEGAPADFGVEDAEAVDNSLGFPAASIALIDQAANLIHGMNANNFTMAAYHVADKANLADAVKAIEDNLAGRNWLCGFPETLVIVTIDGEFVVSMFGALDIVTPIKDQLTTSYSNAVVAVEKDMME